MGKRAKNRVRISDGENCPKCARVMDRFGHGPSWAPKPWQPYYFAWWDICAPCRHMQNYEPAKRIIDRSENNSDDYLPGILQF